ncbi:MAG: hypothetical protein ABI844_19360 [Saprospiraceae bacterium]
MRVMLFCFGILLIQCKNQDSKSIHQTQSISRDLINGNWTVTNAIRNNRPTQTINGAIFTISEGKMTHNLYGIDKTYDFTMVDSTLLASDQTKYKIEFLTDSILVINTVLQTFHFKMSLKRIDLDLDLESAPTPINY